MGPFVALCAVLSACQLVELSEDLETIDELGFIEGTVAQDVPGDGPFAIALFSGAMRGENLVNAKLSETRDFRFAALAGTYYIFAFEDRNKDFQYQADEPAGFHGLPTPIELAGGEEFGDVRIELRLNPPLPESDNEGSARRNAEGEDQPLLWAGRRNIGAMAALKDSRFDQDVADLGMWEPLRFSLDIGPGLFFLEPYDSAKTPVLFVHGIRGTPRAFGPIIDSLDQRRFQPWILAYASGLPLDANAEYLRDALTQLSFLHNFERLYLVAHSMGGLVSRAFIHRYLKGRARYLGLFVTLSTPWGGHDAAQLAVDYAPVVAPVWRDMAPDSAFLEGLRNGQLPEDLPHHLLFSFRGGGLPSTTANDGVVTLASQLDPFAQSRANRIYGFDTSHTEILSDEAVIRLLNEILSETHEVAADQQTKL